MEGKLLYIEKTPLKIALSGPNLPYTQKEIEEITEILYHEFNAMNSRELSSDWLVIFMNAMETKLRCNQRCVFHPKNRVK